MARALNKTDFDQVVPADTAGFAASMIVGPNSSTAAAQWIDDPSGNLERTAIAAISSDASENKIHIINLSNANPPSNPADEFVFRGWKMIKVDRDGDAYRLQYANLDGSDRKEVRVEKSASHRFTYYSFGNGKVNIAPQDNRWDIAWSAYSNLIPFQGGLLPYFFQDIVLQNLAGTRTAEVMVSDISYENFNTENIQVLLLKTKTNWPSGRAGDLVADPDRDRASAMTVFILFTPLVIGITSCVSPHLLHPEKEVAHSLNTHCCLKLSGKHIIKFKRGGGMDYPTPLFLLYVRFQGNGRKTGVRRNE